MAWPERPLLGPWRRDAGRSSDAGSASFRRNFHAQGDLVERHAERAPHHFPQPQLGRPGLRLGGNVRRLAGERHLESLRPFPAARRSRRGGIHRRRSGADAAPGRSACASGSCAASPGGRSSAAGRSTSHSSAAPSCQPWDYPRSKPERLQPSPAIHSCAGLGTRRSACDRAKSGAGRAGRFEIGNDHCARGGRIGNRRRGGGPIFRRRL